LLCFAILVLMCGLCGSIAAGQENQIVNGEFDDGINAWNSYGAAGFTFQVVQGAAMSGNNAVMIDVTDASAATAIGIAQGGLGLVQGQTYQIGFTGKAEQDREMVVLFQIYKPEIPQWQTPWETTVQLTTTPQSFNFEYTHETETSTEHPNWSVDIYYMLKGAYWTMNGDDLNVKVWIDRIYFGEESVRQSVEKATNPEPADGAVLEDTWVTLRWSAGDLAVSHDVYFGENFDDVNNGTGDAFRGNQRDTYFVVGFPGFPYPDGLVPGTTYYWRIDEVNEVEPNSPWKGPVWSFTVPPKKAHKPKPGDGIKFVDPDVTISWAAGFGAKLHHVYFGENSADVEAGTGSTYKGPSVNASFVAGTLEREKTYYWRVDEFDGIATNTGELWSFTIAREGGGLKAEYFNNTTLSGEPVVTAVEPQIDFDWGNGDVPGENSPDPSVNVDDFSARWSAELEVDVTDTYTFQITANNGFRLWLDDKLIIDFWDNGTTNTRQSEPIDLIGGNTYSIRMEYYEGAGTAIAQLFWESGSRELEIIPQAALSPPRKAGSPSPANGAVGAPMDLVLTWSPGDLAASHEVYFGTDADAVKSATAASPEYKGAKALGSESYNPGKLAWATTYYWRVDEINSQNPESPWIGSVWSFTTADFLLVDDFESYNDIDPPDAASNRIFDKWIDGFGTTNNGSLVGNDLPPYAEQAIVHGGGQSMPYFYDNNLKTSEATLTLVSRRDWTAEGVAKLSIWFIGDAANAPERMFVALNGSAVVYHDDPAAMQTTEWTEWLIDLQAFADQGVNLTNINTITIGFGTKNSPAAGGSGQMYFDDIRLYR
ncbi:MAG: PA14 domain-containing protein, partial [Planctomycetota bacterium]